MPRATSQSHRRRDPTAAPAKSNLRDRYERALALFLDQARADPYILAVVLCGSLAHDSVWEKSDIDLVVICKEKSTGYEKKDSSRSFALVVDDINIHATLQPRNAFRKMDVIKTAGHVIDLGPEGGHSGGEVIATGTPEEVAKVKRSFTGQFLRGKV